MKRRAVDWAIVGGAVLVLAGLWVGMQMFRHQGGGVAADSAEPVRGRAADLAHPPVIYSSDFGRGADDGWSSQHLETAPKGQIFLGQFDNDPVKLSLVKLPPHGLIRVSFDLHIINSWDGCGREQDWAEWKIDGPDFFILERVDGPTLMRASFSNIPRNWNHYASWQTYPSPIPSKANPMGTGAAALNRLGYLFSFPGADRQYELDSTYAVSVVFPHREPALRLRMEGENLQGVFDEGWGISNVKVEALEAGAGAIADEAKRAELWRTALSANPVAARAAFWALAGAGDETVAFIERNVGGFGVDRERFERLLGELEDEAQAESAVEGLVEMGPAIEPMLQEAMRANRPLREPGRMVLRRIEIHPIEQPDRRSAAAAARLLYLIDTPAARQLAERLLERPIQRPEPATGPATGP